MDLAHNKVGTYEIGNVGLKQVYVAMALTLALAPLALNIAVALFSSVLLFVNLHLMHFNSPILSPK